jgi:two-component system cell cycle response regulator
MSANPERDQINWRQIGRIMAGRVLIVDDQATARLSLRVRLSAARYDVATATSGDEAIAAAAEGPPDLVIVDERLSDMSGPALCARLKSDPSSRDIPVLILVGARDAAGRVAALDAGAEDVLTKPYCDVALMARLRSLMRVRETRSETRRRQDTAAAFGFAEAQGGYDAPGRIALVTADASTASRWTRGLRGLVPDNVQALDPDAALDEGDRPRAADLFVIDDTLPRPGGGLALLSDLRSRPGTRHAAIILAHRDADPEAGATALDLGANDLLPLSADPAEMAIRIRTQMGRKREADRLRTSVEDGMRLAATDALTGLFNRRYALAYLDRVARECRGAGRGYAVMLADLDHFKHVNDRHGHAAGDAVLRNVARHLRDHMRSENMVARLGGEEFLLVMPDTDFASALATAQRLCASVAKVPVRPGRASAPIHVTVSIGVAVCGPDTPADVAPEALIEQADRALYNAKALGRNTVDVFRPAA